MIQITHDVRCNLPAATFRLQFAANAYDKVCQTCWHLHSGDTHSLDGRQWRVLPADVNHTAARNLLDELTAVAKHHLQPSVSAAATQPQPPQPLQPPLLPLHTSLRYHTPTLKTQQQLLPTVTTPQDGTLLLCKAGIAPRNHGRYLTRYEQQLAITAVSPKRERQPQTAKRLSGAGRKTALTAQQEIELRVWVDGQRRCEARFAVSDWMVQREAWRRWGLSSNPKVGERLDGCAFDST